MKPEYLTAGVAIVVAASQAANVYMFLKIRVAQLESEKRVLDQVEKQYVKRETFQLVCGHRLPS